MHVDSLTRTQRCRLRSLGMLVRKLLAVWWSNGTAPTGGRCRSSRSIWTSHIRPGVHLDENFTRCIKGSGISTNNLQAEYQFCSRITELYWVHSATLTCKPTILSPIIRLWNLVNGLRSWGIYLPKLTLSVTFCPARRTRLQWNHPSKKFPLLR